MELNKFEQYAKEIPGEDDRMAVLQIADNCFMARLWFESYGLDYTTSDVLKFADMVRARREALDW